MKLEQPTSLKMVVAETAGRLMGMTVATVAKGLVYAYIFKLVLR